MPTSPTSMSVSCSPPPSGTYTSYTFTATPVGGGSPVSVTCSSSYSCNIKGLVPGTTYDVQVVAKDSAGKITPPSAPVQATTPKLGVPAIIAATPTSPSSIGVTLTPVSGATSYMVTATPVNGGSPIKITCATPACTIPGLSPGTSYSIMAVATTPSGTSPSSQPETITTPPAGYGAYSCIWMLCRNQLGWSPCSFSSMIHLQTLMFFCSTIAGHLL